jgi:pseudaminic acid biosynthesis-associated methylase
MNEQEKFWRDTYAADYLRKNREFNQALGARAWQEMLRKAEGIETILECGSNVGGNIGFLDALLPRAKKSIIELSPEAYAIVTRTYQLAHAFNGSILDSSLPQGGFDLVFTRGVLIHIHPDSLAENMARMLEYSRRYVLFAEYFSRTPEMLEYQGVPNKLFKRDFGKFFLERFPVDVVDHGFLWSHIYEQAGFDDITWWLFRKK